MVYSLCVLFSEVCFRQLLNIPIIIIILNGYNNHQQVNIKCKTKNIHERMLTNFNKNYPNFVIWDYRIDRIEQSLFIAHCLNMLQILNMYQLTKNSLFLFIHVLQHGIHIYYRNKNCAQGLMKFHLQKTIYQVTRKILYY